MSPGAGLNNRWTLITYMYIHIQCTHVATLYMYMLAADIPCYKACLIYWIWYMLMYMYVAFFVWDFKYWFSTLHVYIILQIHFLWFYVHRHEYGWRSLSQSGFNRINSKIWFAAGADLVADVENAVWHSSSLHLALYCISSLRSMITNAPMKNLKSW